MCTRCVALWVAGCLISVMFAAAVPIQSQTPPDSQSVEKLKAKVAKIGLRNEITVTLNNRDIYHGSVDDIAVDSFKVAEVDLHQVMEFRFSEVRKIEKGYGHSRDVYGRRIPPRKHNFGLALGLAAILIPVVIIAAALHSDY